MAVKGNDQKKINSKLPDDIKEKTYLTRHVETSIAILESPENDIVLEALLFLSKYANIRLDNLTYLQQRGLLQKLLNLFDRNICILRLALRLLDILLTIDDVMVEFNQGIYDKQIKRITEFYIYHEDQYVKEFSVNILIKLATTCRITCLIFSVDLLNPILHTLQQKKNQVLVKTTIKLLHVLLSSPAVLSSLPELEKFDITVILEYLNDQDVEISKCTFDIVERLTNFSLDVYQNIFRSRELVEEMMEVVMNSEKVDKHEIALKIILNCMNSDLTSSYFVESIQFLQFCLWVKTCGPDYLRPCVQIFSQLSAMPQIRQMLFDLSVEESILIFLRSTDKYILNQTCEAISNMSEHKYCCEEMLTPVVVGVLCDILVRTDDEEDPENAIVIKTITNLMRRSLKTMDLLNVFSAQQVFIDMFRKGLNSFSQQSYLRIVEILYQFAVHPIYQESVICKKFFEELIKVVQNGTVDVANLCVELLTYFIPHPEFMALFLDNQGPSIVLNKLKTTDNPQLFKNLLVLIHSLLSNEIIIMKFIKDNIVNTLKGFSERVKQRSPLINTILNLTYDVYLPLKFFEMNRLEITDKLNNQFYLITGKWTKEFPFLEIFRLENLSPITTMYVVDYSYEMIPPKLQISTTTIETGRKAYSENKGFKTGFPPSTTQFIKSPNDIKYGDLSPDPFLPSYIYHIQECFEYESDFNKKIKMLAEYVDTILCGPNESLSIPQKFHTFQLHLQTLKFKLGTNMIPIGYLRIGFHCEKSLLFKAIADRTCIPCSLVKGPHNCFWNEVAIFSRGDEYPSLTIYIVDLMNNIGNLIPRGSKEANYYCSSKKF